MENNIYAKNEVQCFLQLVSFIAIMLIIIGMVTISGGIQDIQRIITNSIIIQWFIDILLGFFMLFLANPSGINNGLIAVGFGLFLIIVVIIVEFYVIYSKSQSSTQKHIGTKTVTYKPIIESKMATRDVVLEGFLSKSQKEDNTQINKVEGFQKRMDDEGSIIKDSEKIFQIGLDNSQKALISIENGNYEEAIKFYLDAIKTLAEFANNTKNLGLKNICTERINYYTEKIMELKEKLVNKSHFVNEKDEAIKILRVRLAKGEITIEEYNKLKNYL